MITKLPKGEYMIGIKEIVKNIDNLDKIFFAENCPEEIKEKIPESINTEVFSGDQQELGNRIGKPFPIAVIALKKGNSQ